MKRVGYWVYAGLTGAVLAMVGIGVLDQPRMFFPLLLWSLIGYLAGWKVRN